MSRRDIPPRPEQTDNRTRIARGTAAVEYGRFSRRTVLKTLGGGTVASGIFAASGAARRLGSEASAAGSDTLTAQLNAVRSMTRKYRNVATARADGYEFFGVNPPVGHVFQKSDYFDGKEFTGPTSITEPPSLLFYAPNNSEGETDDSDLILAGVEYHTTGDRSCDPPNLFADENASRTLKVTEAEGWHRSPIPDALDVTGLHVWAHLRNPEGVFHVGHPTILRRVSD